MRSGKEVPQDVLDCGLSELEYAIARDCATLLLCCSDTLREFVLLFFGNVALVVFY